MRTSTGIKLALTALCCGAATPALAWGNVGHATIADIAELNLQPAVLAEVKSLIATDGATYLADIASWADETAQRVLGSPIHTTRIPVDGSPAPAHACPQGGMCADEAIAYYSAILADHAQPVAAREEALKYIVHLVGDLHQPLHGSDPIGYNMVQIGLSVKGIHAVWDKDIIEDHGVPSALLAQELMNNGVSVTLGGTPRGWAQESSDMARDHIYDTLPACYTAKQPICPALAVLPASYTADKYPFVAQRLKQAGYRLAAVLNSLLGTA